jgi:hypothetical protein
MVYCECTTNQLVEVQDHSSVIDFETVNSLCYNLFATAIEYVVCISLASIDKKRLLLFSSEYTLGNCSILFITHCIFVVDKRIIV